MAETPDDLAGAEVVSLVPSQEQESLAPIPESQIVDAEIGAMEEEIKPKTPYDRQAQLLYRWVRQLIIDQAEGRGDITGIDRRLIHLTTLVPELIEIGAEASSERDKYFRFTDICDPLSKEAGTNAEIEGELIQAIGPEEFEKLFNELVALALENPVPADVDGRLMAAYLGWQSYLKAALLMFHGLYLGFKRIGELSNKTALQFTDPLTVSWVTHMRWEILRGLASKTIEEKTLIQGEFFIAYAVAWGVFTEKDGEEFIRACILRLQWAWIFTKLGSGWLVHNQQAAVTYRKAFARVFGPSAAFFENAPPAESAAQEFPELPEKFVRRPQYPYALFLIDHMAWLSGMTPTEAQYMKPYRNFKYRSTQTYGATFLFVGPRGSGKTAASISVALLGIWHGMLGLMLKSDTTNQGVYMMLPAFHDQKIVPFLENVMGVSPSGVPTMVLHAIRPSQRHLLKDVPFTPYSVVIEIDNPNNFELDWGIVMDAFKRVHAEFPVDPKPKYGAIVNWNFNRLTRGFKENEDLKIAACLNFSVNQWQMQQKERIPIIHVLDEVKDVWAREISGGIGGTDISTIKGQFGQTLVDGRRLNYSIVCNTQQPKDLVDLVFNNLSHLFFRNLDPGQMDFMREVIQLRDESERDIVRSLNESNALGPHMNFMYTREERRMDVVYVCPPSTQLEVVSQDARVTFEEYEKKTGQRWLIDYKDIKWNEVTIARCRGTGRRRGLPAATPEEQETEGPQIPRY